VPCLCLERRWKGRLWRVDGPKGSCRCCHHQAAADARIQHQMSNSHGASGPLHKTPLVCGVRAGGKGCVEVGHAARETSETSEYSKKQTRGISGFEILFSSAAR